MLRQAERDRDAGRPPLEALTAHLYGLARVARRHRGLSAAFACAVQEQTARTESRADPGDDGDPRALVPVPHGLALLIEAGQRAGAFSTERDATDLAEQLTFLLFLRCFTHPDETADETEAMLRRIVLGVLRPELLLAR